MAGGLTKGKSHAKGGIKMKVKSTGQNIEVEGGEGIINKHTMSSTDKHTFEGKEMTACEIASDLNQKTGNGVSFDCDETKNTDMTPTDPSTGFAKGGKPKRKYKKKKMAKSKKKTGAFGKLVSKIMKRDGIPYKQALTKAKDEYVSGATSQKKQPKKSYKGRLDKLKSKSTPKKSYSGRPKKAKGGEINTISELYEVKKYEQYPYARDLVAHFIYGDDERGNLIVDAINGRYTNQLADSSELSDLMLGYENTWRDEGNMREIDGQVRDYFSEIDILDYYAKGGKTNSKYRVIISYNSRVPLYRVLDKSYSREQMLSPVIEYFNSYESAFDFYEDTYLGIEDGRSVATYLQVFENGEYKTLDKYDGADYDDYAKGGKVNKHFDIVYKKYRAKGYFGLDDIIKNKIEELKSFQKKGDKEALKYTEADIKKYVEDDNYNRTYEYTYKPIIDAIKNNDKDFLKSRIRYDQKLSKEFYESYTGKKLPKTNAALIKYFDLNYAKGGELMDADTQVDYAKGGNIKENDTLYDKNGNKYIVNTIEGDTYFLDDFYMKKIAFSKKEVEKLSKKRPYAKGGKVTRVEIQPIIIYKDANTTNKIYRGRVEGKKEWEKEDKSSDKLRAYFMDKYGGIITLFQPTEDLSTYKEDFAYAKGGKTPKPKFLHIEVRPRNYSQSYRDYFQPYEKKFKVSSFKDASEKFRIFVAENNLGASNIWKSDILDTKQKPFAYVSYNGRVFTLSDKRELYDGRTGGKTAINYAKGGKIDWESNSPKIYVASLSDYNAGRLEGEWFDFDQYDDEIDLMTAIEDMLDALNEKYKDGENREEWAVHDHEYTYGIIGEYSGEKDFEKVYALKEAVEESGLPFEVLTKRVADTRQEVDEVGDDYYGAYDSEEDFADEFKDQAGMSSEQASYYVYCDEVTARVVAGEEADQRAYQDYDDDEILEMTGMEDEYKEADDDDKEDILDKAKESIYDEVYDEWYRGLRDDAVDFLVNVMGIYSEEDVVNLNWLSFNLERWTRDLMMDFDSYYNEEDGMYYIFTR